MTTHLLRALARLALPFTAVLLAVAVPPSAAAETITKVVPSTLQFRHGNKPGDGGNCSSVAFVQWAHIPNAKVISATATFTWGTGTRSASGAPPYNDKHTYVADYEVQPDKHWLIAAYNAQDGHVDCNGGADLEARLRGIIRGPTKVVLTIEKTDPPIITSAQSTTTMKGRRRTPIGWIECPKDGKCRATTDSYSQEVVVDGRTLRLTVKVPAFVHGGYRQAIAVQLKRPVPNRLYGKVFRVEIKVTASNGASEVTKTVARSIELAPPGD